MITRDRYTSLFKLASTYDSEWDKFSSACQKYLKMTKTNLLLINLPNHITIQVSHMKIRWRYIQYHSRTITLNLFKKDQYLMNST